MCFEEFASAIKRLNIDVVNLFPESELKCFRFSSIEEVISKT